MAQKSKSLVSTAGTKAAGKSINISPNVGAMLVGQIFDSAFNYLSVRQQEMTKREAIRAEAEVRIEQIRANKEMFMSYIENSFKERAYVYKELFDRLDKGIENNDIHLIDVAMTGIVSQIKQNPLGDFKAFRENLRDPNHVEEF
jgi:predicted glycosyl hydrolase (DUF1957 family)